MTLRKLLHPERGWPIGVKLIAFAIPPLVLTTILAAWAVHERTATTLQERLTKRARILATQIMAERTYYAKFIVPRILELGGSLGPDFRERHGRFPVPATFLREVSELAGSGTEGFEASPISPWPINKDDGLKDQFHRDAIDYLATHRTGEFVRTDTMEGRRVLRVLVADHASVQACVDCHNAHPQSPRHDFKLNDLMGGLEIVLPMDQYLQESRQDLALTVLVGTGLCLLVLGVVALGTRRTISRPLAQMADMIQQAETRGVGPTAKAAFNPGGDEVGHLTDLFKRLQEVIARQQAQLREVNVRLEQRVVERTKALQAMEEQYRVTMASLPVSVVRLGRDKTVQFANQMFYQTFSRSPADTIGRRLSEVFPADGLEEAFRVVNPAELTTGEWEVECQMPAGKRQTFRVSARGVGREDCEEEELVMVIEDQTDRKRMELQLRQADKLAALGTLLGGVAHELNNPLFMINGNVQLAVGKIKRNLYEGLADHLAAIQEAAKRASAIVQRFLGVARSGGGRRDHCEVNGLIRQTLGLVANDLQIHQIDVRTDLQADLPPVSADQQELIQVFLNLFTNARQAMASANERGTLTVTTALDEDHGKPCVEVGVCDDGPGIPPEALSRIFEPFYTTKPVGEGTGLGLAICYRIVTDLGGTLHVESLVGQGTLFTVRLPVTREEQHG